MSLAESWQFKREGVLGYIVGGGEHGVQIVTTADGKPATRPMCLNLEHYYSGSCRDGRFVPRNKAEVHSQRLDEDTVRVRIEPYENWEIETTTTFRLLPGVVIEASYEFSFLRDFQAFQVLISNYFQDPVEPFIRVNGEWRQPRLSDREHRYWTRGAQEAEDIGSIVLLEIRPEEDIDLPVDEDRYEYPIMVTPIPGSEQSIVKIVEPSCCVSLSANRRWNAHDFSLGFGDVTRGQTAGGRAWLCCTTLASHDDAVSLLEELTGSSAQQNNPWFKKPRGLVSDVGLGPMAG